MNLQKRKSNVKYDEPPIKIRKQEITPDMIEKKAIDVFSCPSNPMIIDKFVRMGNKDFEIFRKQFFDDDQSYDRLSLSEQKILFCNQIADNQIYGCQVVANNIKNFQLSRPRLKKTPIEIELSLNYSPGDNNYRQVYNYFVHTSIRGLLVDIFEITPPVNKLNFQNMLSTRQFTFLDCGSILFEIANELCITIPKDYVKNVQLSLICQQIEWEMENSYLVISTFVSMCSPDSLKLLNNQDISASATIANFDENFSFLALILQSLCLDDLISIGKQIGACCLSDYNHKKIIQIIKQFIFNKIVVFRFPDQDYKIY